MNPFLLAFLTGVTTGGLSCLAVQGGLLVTSFAPTSSKLREKPTHKKGRHNQENSLETAPTAGKIVIFLLAKLFAYTLLGLLLGALGSMLQLTALTRALLMIAIAIFMVGNGLRMLNVHPIFRYFAFEPPAVVTRYLRRTTKTGETAIKPIILGILTVLIPCGVTQAMMALAMGTGNAFQAAGLMASFTIGSSFVFFTVIYLATRLGKALEKSFTTIVAVVLLVLGLVSFDSGLNLMGAPFSFSRLYQNISSQNQEQLSPTPSAPGSLATDTLTNGLQIIVSNRGYQPAILRAKPETAYTLTFVTDKVTSCARALVIPELGFEQVLPTSGEVTIEISAQEQGKTIRYSCSMGMYSGEIVFDQ